MYSEVMDNLYIGDADSVKYPEAAREDGIQSIVRLDLKIGQPRVWPDDFDVLYTPFPDGESIPDGIINRVTAFIHKNVEEDRAVLVHCHQGISRSATMILAYLIEYEGMSLGEAFVMLRGSHPMAYPHEALLVSLIEHYDLPFDTTTVVNPQFLAFLMRDG